MKCPKCGKNRRYRDGMRCSCLYHFVLDPKRDRFTDSGFLAVCRQASGNDTYFFTRNQLTAAFCRRERRGLLRRVLTRAIFGLVVVGGSFFFSELLPPGWWIWAVVCGLAIAVFLPVAAVMMPPDQRRFEKCVRKWLAVGPEIPRLLTEPSLQEPPPEWEEPDIYDYGVESLLVVQHDLLVDLLVRNGFHASQRCLVIAESGYPAYLVSKAAELLAAQPELPVFLLHDATPQGVAMQARMQQASLLPLREAIDLGIYPADVARLARLKPMLKKRGDYQIAVDFIPYGMLASGLKQAMDRRTTLADVIHVPHAPDSGSVNDGGWFGHDGGWFGDDAGWGGDDAGDFG